MYILSRVIATIVYRSLSEIISVFAFDTRVTRLKTKIFSASYVDLLGTIEMAGSRTQLIVQTDTGHISQGGLTPIRGTGIIGHDNAGIRMLQSP